MLPAPTTTPAELEATASDLQARINHAEFSRAANDDEWGPTRARVWAYLERRGIGDAFTLALICAGAWALMTFAQNTMGAMS